MACVALIAVAAGFGSGRYWHVSAEGASPMITAQGLKIVDEQGNLRAAILVNAQNGATSLSIFDPNTKNSRVVLGVRPDGVGTVEVRDSAGTKRGELVSTGAGATRFAFWDQDAQSA